MIITVNTWRRYYTWNDIKKIINTIDTNGTIEIEHSVTKEQLDFLSQSIQSGYELAIKDCKNITKIWYENHATNWEVNNLVDDLFGREFLQSLLKWDLLQQIYTMINLLQNTTSLCGIE